MSDPTEPITQDEAIEFAARFVWEQADTEKRVRMSHAILDEQGVPKDKRPLLGFLTWGPAMKPSLHDVDRERLHEWLRAQMEAYAVDCASQDWNWTKTCESDCEEMADWILCDLNMDGHDKAARALCEAAGWVDDGH